MAIDAVLIVALVTSLARRLLRDNTKCLQLLAGEVVVVVVWALIWTTCIVVAAAHADVVLIAAFHLLHALDFVAVVVARDIDALAGAVALDRRLYGLVGWATKAVGQRAVLVLGRHGGPGGGVVVGRVA